MIRDDDVPPDLAHRAMIAGLFEDMTNFRHNLGTHNVALTDVAIATINRMPARHPVRRVLPGSAAAHPGEYQREST